MSNEQLKKMEFDLEILKLVKEQTGIAPENSNILEALEDAHQRNKLYRAMEIDSCNKREEAGLNPFECHNMVCNKYSNGNICLEEYSCAGCLFRMIDPPVNNLNYDKTPTYREALALLEKHGIIFDSLIKEELEKYMNMKPTLQEMRDLYEIKAPIWKLKRALDEVLKFLEIDDNRISRNFSVELEKITGTYPNIR